MTDNLKETYFKLRNEFYSDGIVIATKNKVFDFIVFSFLCDRYVKLVKEKERASVQNYIYYMKSISKRRRSIKIIYVLIYLDSEYKESYRESLEIEK